MAVIVVAEDEFLIADMLVSILEDEGHQVESAPNGRAALDILQERRPDLLITDFMMPLMTGLELATAVRQQEHLAALPILLVSGAQAGIGRERPDLFDRVVDKPYKIPDLLDVVAALLSGQAQATI